MNLASTDSDVQRRGRRGYDRLASSYALIERIAFGPQLQRSRVALVNNVPHVRRVLMLGDGDGRLLAVLATTYSDATFLSLDQSRGMLTKQRQRVPPKQRSRITWVQADAREIDLQPGHFDLVVMPYFLDCFDRHELDRHLPRWLSWLDDRGTLLHIDFKIPDGRWQRLVANPLLAVMHGFFRYTTGLSNRHLINVDSMLQTSGWVRHREVRMHGDMIRSALYRRQRVDSADHLPAKREQPSMVTQTH